MDELLLEVSAYTGEGYKPLVDFETWRVAYLRYIDELEPDNIQRVERHLQTDEVFVLLTGQAVLFIGNGEENVRELTAYSMKPCQLYNVKQNAWHTIVLSRDATVLLVENRDTGEDNSEYCLITSVQKDMIKKTAKREIGEAVEPVVGDR
jgi:ureidoglycolate hydrolase